IELQKLELLNEAGADIAACARGLKLACRRHQENVVESIAVMGIDRRARKFRNRSYRPAALDKAREASAARRDMLCWKKLWAIFVLKIGNQGDLFAQRKIEQVIDRIRSKQHVDLFAL